MNKSKIKDMKKFFNEIIIPTVKKEYDDIRKKHEGAVLQYQYLIVENSKHYDVMNLRLKDGSIVEEKYPVPYLDK